MIVQSHLPRVDFRWWGLAVVGAAGLAVAPIEQAPTVCPFALMTGTACPGCGLTRAAGALFRGDLAASWAFHPLVMVVLLWLAGAGVMWMRRRRGVVTGLSSQVVNRLLIGTAAVFVVTWIARLVTGTLPPV